MELQSSLVPGTPTPVLADSMVVPSKVRDHTRPVAGGRILGASSLLRSKEVAFWNAESAPLAGLQQVLGRSWSGACVPPCPFIQPSPALLSREKLKTLCLLQGTLSCHLHPDQY